MNTRHRNRSLCSLLTHFRQAPRFRRQLPFFPYDALPSDRCDFIITAQLILSTNAAPTIDSIVLDKLPNATFISIHL